MDLDGELKKISFFLKCGRRYCYDSKILKYNPPTQWSSKTQNQTRAGVGEAHEPEADFGFYATQRYIRTVASDAREPSRVFHRSQPGYVPLNSYQPA